MEDVDIKVCPALAEAQEKVQWGRVSWAARAHREEEDDTSGVRLATCRASNSQGYF